MNRAILLYRICSIVPFITRGSPGCFVSGTWYDRRPTSQLSCMYFRRIQNRTPNKKQESWSTLGFLLKVLGAFYGINVSVRTPLLLVFLQISGLPFLLLVFLLLVGVLHCIAKDVSHKRRRAILRYVKACFDVMRVKLLVPDILHRGHTRMGSGYSTLIMQCGSCCQCLT